MTGSYIDDQRRRLVSSVDDAARQPGALAEEDGGPGGDTARTGRHSAADPRYLRDALSVLFRVESLQGGPGGVEQDRGLVQGSHGQGHSGPYQLPRQVEARGDGVANLVSQLLTMLRVSR